MTSTTPPNTPKFYPVDAMNAYPEPVGTLDQLEHSDGAVWVHLNGKRSKLVGVQSLAFLIGNLQTIHNDVFGEAPGASEDQQVTGMAGQLDLLGTVLGEILVAAGMIQPGFGLTGPQLLQFGTELRDHLAARATTKRDQLVAMVDAAMVEMGNIHPPLKRSECERLIRAALEQQS